MKKELIEAFGLTGVTEQSSDTAVLAALQAKFKENADRLTALELEAKTKKTAAIKAALDTAQTAGKITAETRPTYEGIGEASGIEVLNTVLAGLGTKQPITSVITGGKGSSTGSPTDEKDWNWYQKNDAKALDTMVKDNPEQFKALYKKEYGTDPVIE